MLCTIEACAADTAGAVCTTATGGACASTSKAWASRDGAAWSTLRTVSVTAAFTRSSTSTIPGIDQVWRVRVCLAKLHVPGRGAVLRSAALAQNVHSQVPEELGR